MGLIAAGEIACREGVLARSGKEAAGRIAGAVGVPGGLAEVEAERILTCAKADKKRVDGQLRFVLGRRIGEVEVVEGITDDTVRAAIAYAQRVSAELNVEALWRGMR